MDIKTKKNSKLNFRINASEASKFYYHVRTPNNMHPFNTFVPEVTLTNNNPWLKNFFINISKKLEIEDVVETLSISELNNIIETLSIADQIEKIIEEDSKILDDDVQIIDDIKIFDDVQDIKDVKDIKVSDDVQDVKDIKVSDDVQDIKDVKVSDDVQDIKDIKVSDDVKVAGDIEIIKDNSLIIDKTFEDIRVIEEDKPIVEIKPSTKVPSSIEEDSKKEILTKKKNVLKEDVRYSERIKKLIVKETVDNLDKKIETSITEDNSKGVQWLSEVQNDTLKSLVLSDIHTKIGKNEEAKILQNISTPQKPVTDSNSKIYSKVIQINDHIDITIIGKIDGIQDGKLIEAKKRMYKFMGIPLYEKIQIEIYLWMLESQNITICNHIQSFRGETQIITYKKDLIFLEDIKKALSEFFIRFCEKYNL